MQHNSKTKKITGASHEAFIKLIQVAQENDEIKKKLLDILILDEFNRNSALNTLIEEMLLKSAPAEFVTSIACLLDNKIAEKALEILT